jgi:hypothetical protein
MIANADNYLNGLQSELRVNGIGTSTRVVHGPVVKEILFAADRENVDLITISSHSRVVYLGFLMGVSQPEFSIEQTDL